MPDPLRKLWDKGYSIADLWACPPERVERETGGIKDENSLESGMFEMSDYFEGEGYADACLNNNLRAGIWVAIGYRHPRDEKSPLIIIPAEIFGSMDFFGDHSTIYGNGLKYPGVRILHAKSLDAEELNGPQRKPGRPSQKNEILSAYSDLKSRGAINYGHPFARLVSQIRSAIAKKRGTPETQLRGVGKEVIRKTLARQFERDRSSP